MRDGQLEGAVTFYLGGMGADTGMSLTLSFRSCAGSEDEPLRLALRTWAGRVEGVGSTLAIQEVRRMDSGFIEPSAFN